MTGRVTRKIPKQRRNQNHIKLLKFLDDYSKKHGVMPTGVEQAEHLGITVHAIWTIRHLLRLQGALVDTGKGYEIHWDSIYE